MKQINSQVPGQLYMVAQQSKTTCWAAAGTIMMSWQQQRPLDILSALSQAGHYWVRLYDDQIRNPNLGALILSICCRRSSRIVG